MDLSFVFFFNSCLLGIGLAMDAFSVSLANGMSCPKMKVNKMVLVALTFGIFQCIMPLIGWGCIHTIAQVFSWLESLIPWIALILLCFLGIKTLHDGFSGEEEECCKNLTFGLLIIQGIATSIDALSVGLTIANYNIFNALLCSFIIFLLTFIICYIGIILGKKFGTKYSKFAFILGGVILIAIGLEIFITGIC